MIERKLVKADESARLIKRQQQFLEDPKIMKYYEMIMTLQAIPDKIIVFKTDGIFAGKVEYVYSDAINKKVEEIYKLIMLHMDTYYSDLFKKEDK